MKKWNNLSLRTQLIIVFAVIQIIVFSLIFYFFTLNYRDFYLEQLEANLKDNIYLLKSNENIRNNIYNSENLDNIVKDIGGNIETRITIIAEEGRVLADSRYKPELMDNHLGRPEVQQVIEDKNFGNSTRRSDTLNQDMYYLAASFNVNGNKMYIRLAKSLEKINTIIRVDIYWYLFFLIMLLVISNIIVWYFSKSIIKPLKKIKNMAKEIVDGKRRKIDNIKYSNNELGKLVEEYNRLGIELDKKIDNLVEEKNKLSAILNSMNEGVIATDANKNILMMNPKACDMFNINCENVEGKNFINQLRDYKFDEYLSKVLNEENSYSTEMTFKKPEKINLDCNFQTVLDNNGNIIGAVIVLIDVTRIKKLEEMRKDFVANVSHELKTPLTSIKGYADTIIDNEIKDYDTIKKFVGVISKETTRLNLLINDLLELSELEADYFDLKPENLDGILEKPIRILQSEASKKDIEIINQFENDLPLVKMNKPQIENLMINLIDNAIKYTPPKGKIYLRAYDKEGKVYIEVEDTGIGIPKEDQDRIFERFYRVDKARSKEVGGTGIGLSIVKHIVKGHDSEIEVDSKVGEGTTFRFYLNKT
ncbi:MAG: cell wall metabolism sensor histidine kinase WalK [Halanaerobiales bacterium]|nr:cell wall metabolism sensor histidine kinase WalK [Halanaerobiales bacterium]